MTYRKNPISIYDYPEHLNPFREDADDSGDRFSTTGRRRSSFRISAWNVFSPNKGKSKDCMDTNRVSSSITSRFMTWTPQLLRKASFSRSSASRSSVGPREMQTSVGSRLSLKSNATQYTIPSSSSRSSLPPTSSRAAPHSISSRSTLPTSDNLDAHPYSRNTSPPGRPARTSLSPGRPFSPAPITLSETPSTENAPNNVNEGCNQTTPVPAVRKVSSPALASANTVGEQPSNDETKFLKQGAKPKKKRRAPVPPVSSPGKSTSDIREFNSNVSDASVTSPVIACSAEDLPPQEEIPPAISHLEVITHESQLDTKNRESHDSFIRKSEQLNGEQILNSENRSAKLHSDNEVEHSDQSKGNQQDPQQWEPTHVNGHSEDADDMNDRVHIVRLVEILENVLKKEVDHEGFHGDEGAHDKPELQSAPENELQENLNQTDNENLTCQKDREAENTQRQNHFDDGDQETTTDTTTNKYKLYNGKNLSSENIDLQNGEQLNIRNTQQMEKITTPKPKPRTVRPNM